MYGCISCTFKAQNIEYFYRSYLTISPNRTKSCHFLLYQELQSQQGLKVLNFDVLSSCRIYVIIQMQMKNKAPNGLQINQIEGKPFTPSLQCNEQDYPKKIIIQPYPTDVSIRTIFLISICYFLHIMPIEISYILFANNAATTTVQIKDITNQLQYNESSLFCVLLAAKLLIFFTLYLDYNISQAQELPKLLLSVFKHLKSYLRCIIQLDLLFSVLFLCTVTSLSCINFVMSTVVITLSVLFLQNYSNKKGSFFIGSVKFHMIIRIKIIIGSLVSFICRNFSGSNLSFGVFVFAHSMLAIIMLIFYISQGFVIYKNSLLKWTVFTSVAAYLSVAIVMLIGTISRNDVSTMLTFYLLTFLAISYYLYQHVRRVKVKKIQSFDFDGKALCFPYILQQSHNEVETHLLIKGMLSFTQGLNSHFHEHQYRLYGSKTPRYLSNENAQQDILHIAKLYMKRKFQSFLQENQTNFDAIFNYAQFLYLELGSTASSLYWLSKISSNNAKLEFSNKLKWSRLIQRIREDNRQLSQLTFGKNFDIEGLIKAESTKTGIIKSTMEILYQKMEVWKLLGNAIIEISQLRQKTQKIRKGIKQISQSWNRISSFVQRSKNWKFQYYCFVLFLKNQKLSAKLLQDLRTPIQAQQSSRKQPKTVINNVFDVDSCCIHTVIKEGRILIAKASKNCINVTGYSSAQLENANLSLLVPSLIADKHHQTVVNMSKDGISSKGNGKRFSQVYIVNKQGYIVPVQKCYKQFVNELGELEYVCYLKKINTNESVFLCNQTFQIQGFTQKCDKMLSQHKNGIYIKYFNILSFIPELIKAKMISLQNDKKLDSGDPYLAKHKQIKDIFDHSQFCFLKTSQEQSLEYTICFPQQPLQDYITIANNSQKQCLEEQISNIAWKIKNRAHRISLCQFELNCYQNRIGLVYYEVKLKKIKPQIYDSLKKDSRQTKQDNPYLPLKSNRGLLSAYNISSKSNIYIKQEANEAPKANFYLTCIKYLWFILFAGIIFFSILNMFLFEQQFNNMAVSINNIYIANQLLIAMSQLVNLYISKILNIPAARTISAVTDNFFGFLNNPQINQAFFEKNINPPVMYYAASDLSQNGSGYNQIDLLYFTQSLFRTLSLTDEVKTDSYSYNLVMDFQYPALNNFLNLTNTNLSTEFTAYEDTLKLEYNLVFIIEMLLITMSAGLILFYSYKFYSSMLEMVKVHCHFAPRELSNSVRHLKNVIRMFQGLQQLEDSSFLPNELSSRHCIEQSIQGQANNPFNNLNKKQKNIVTGKQLQRKRQVYFVKIIGCFFAFIALCFSRNLYFMSLEYPALYQMNEGQNFVSPIPTHYLTAQIVANSFSPIVLPSFHLEQYQPLISNLYLMMNMPYLPILQSDDAFSQLINQFYFSDACLISISALKSNNITLEECQTVANRSLKEGLRGYSRYQYMLLQDISSNSFTLSLQQVKQYLRSIDIYHSINEYVMDAWVDNYSKLTTDTSTKIERFTLLACLAIFLLIIIFKLHIFRYLKGQYQFYSFFYATMMSQQIVSGQKIIRSKLVEIKFL